MTGEAGSGQRQRRPVVGVLGGMGPYAALEFVRNVLERTPAERDWDHVHMVLDNHPRIPSRSRAVLYGEESPLEEMAAACRRLERFPVDVIAVPCNSAGHWHGELQKQVKTPVLDIVAIAVSALPDDPAVRRVAALGGMVPHLTGLYRGPLERAGRELVRLADADQERVVGVIEAVKLAGSAGASLRRDFGALVADLADRYRLDAVILACTEFSFFKDDAFTVPMVDSSSALAQFVVDYAVHGRALRLDVDEVRRFWDARAAMIERDEAGILQSTMLTQSEEDARMREAAEKAALLGRVGPLLSPSAAVLELGCGTGRWTRTLARHVGQVVACDYNERFVDLARRLTEQEGIRNVTYHCCGVEDVPRDRPYDAVVSIALLHYLDEAQLEAVLDVVRRCVKPGGLAIFRETFGVERRFELHGFYSDVLKAPYHAVYRTTAEIASRLGGFERLIEDTTLPPASGKPETCQKLLVFQREPAA